MVYEAYPSIFGPVGGFMVAGNVLSRAAASVRASVWRFRGLKLVLALLAGFWAPWALENAHRWGVDAATLATIQQTLVDVQGQLPALNALPWNAFLFILVFLAVYFVIFGRGSARTGMGMGY